MPSSAGPGPAGHAPLSQGRRPQPAQKPIEAGEADSRADSVALQQKAGNGATAASIGPSRGELVRSVVEGPGRPVGPDVVEAVRDTTGDDASGIVVHDGPEAAAAARSVEANMFASGNHIVAPEGLDVSTHEGLFKTVHEVHHVVNQQAKGPVEGTDTGDGLSISDPNDRFEQEADAAGAAAVLSKMS